VADYDCFSEKYGEAAKGGSLHSSAPSWILTRENFLNQKDPRSIVWLT
jgi:hypothetical protein